VLTWLVVAAVIGLLPAAIAHNKGQSFALWWLYGAALFIVALPHAILLKPDARALAQRGSASGMKQCPDCAELVKSEARKCRFCGHEFGEVTIEADGDIARYAVGGSLRQQPDPITAAAFLPAAIGVAILVLAVILVTVFLESP
jgi:uncharacterized membrane protein YeaQ/YmgE (transglycosylase-associated protein family)